MGGIAGSIAGSVVSSVFSKKGSKKAGKIANQVIPENIRTGNSSYNTKTGEFDIDPSIRQGQDNYIRSLGASKIGANVAFQGSAAGIRELQRRSADIRGDFEGNQSAFREAQLAPIRQSIARREGDLDANLERTKVRGSFAEQSRNALAFDSAKLLRNTEAEIENERLNKMGDFLQIDSNLIKDSLQNETGRLDFVNQLDGLLANVSSERFDQELKMLGLPASYIGGTSKAAEIRANAQGIEQEQNIKLVGDVIGAVDDHFNQPNPDFGSHPGS